MEVALKRRWTVPAWVLEAGGLWLGQHIVVVGLVALIQSMLLGMGLSWSTGTRGFSLLDPFIAWDNQWYTHIALFGYDTAATSAFPPLYPLLEAIGAPIFGSAAVAGVVIANAAGLGACLLLRWVLDPVIGVRASQRTLLYLLCFPMAVFFLAAYTESLFLLLSLAVFAALQRRAFWWAGSFAGLAIMTRYTGAFLVFPLLIALWQARAAWWRYLSAAIAPLLMSGFWLYFIVRFEVLPSAAVYAKWHGTLTWPWVGVVRSLEYLATGGHTLARTQDTARDLILTLVLIALAVGVLRARLPLGYKVYTGTFMLFVLAGPILYPGNYDALFSVPRYLLAIFPLFIPLAQWSLRAKGIHLALLTVSLLASVYLLLGFAVGALIA